jgi:hypothetical protein
MEVMKMAIEMSPEQLRVLMTRIERLEFQVRQLGISLDPIRHPLPQLIIEMGWGSPEFDILTSIFDSTLDKLRAEEAVDWIEFRSKLDEELGVGPPHLKAVITTLFRNGQWTEVCRRYVSEYPHSGLEELL